MNLLHIGPKLQTTFSITLQNQILFLSRNYLFGSNMGNIKQLFRYLLPKGTRRSSLNVPIGQQSKTNHERMTNELI